MQTFQNIQENILNQICAAGELQRFASLMPEQGHIQDSKKKRPMHDKENLMNDPHYARNDISFNMKPQRKDIFLPPPDRVSRQPFHVRPDDTAFNVSVASDLTASLMAENASLKEKVSAYEEKLRQVDSMFSVMMGRIAALEQQTTARSQADISPKSPLGSSRSIRNTSMRNSDSRVRSSSVTRSRPTLLAPTTASRNRSITPTPNNRSVAVASRGRVGSMSSVQKNVPQRSKSPARVSQVTQPATKPISLAPAPAQKRPAAPVIRYEVHIAYNDRVIAKAQLIPALSQDGPFLYVIQSELSPPMCFVPASSTGCPFVGLSISIVGTNTRTRKSNVVFKSHSSHVENPPVNDADGYFSHSCWLSGPSASVVGGVRMFFRTGEDDNSITLYAMSLKFWFPENHEEQSGGFTKEHWKELLKLLGLL